MSRGDGHPQGEALVRAARDFLGTRFRPQGRDRNGLDCVGLVICAGRAIGIGLADWLLPLRGTDLGMARSRLASVGCRQPEAPRSGDVLLSLAATRQVHLAIWTGQSVVEAHAGLGRVVERPCGTLESWDSAWRLPEGDFEWLR